MSYELEDYINPEQLLELGFELFDDDSESQFAQDILGWYVIRSDSNFFEDDDEERFTKELNRLIAQHVLQGCVEQGLMAYDFETNNYSITRFGERVQEELRAEAESND